MQLTKALGGFKVEGWSRPILRFYISLSLSLTLLFAASAYGQSGPLETSSESSESASLPESASASARSTLPADVNSSSFAYVPPTEAQKFRNYASNAVGPVAFVGAAIAGGIDQGFNFPHAWGQGMDAYGSRVSSNLGISLVTATAQYSMAEAFREDTAYYHCTCRGFLPRFWHAAVSSVASRRGDDGHRELSVALIVSPFVGPLVAANTWIPSRNGPALGLRMGVHNLMGQFAQNEAIEFLSGAQSRVVGRLQSFFHKSASPTLQ